MRSITPEEFYLCVKPLVLDALHFIRNSPIHKYPPHMFRHLSIDPRRAIGKTYVAFKLQEEFGAILVYTDSRRVTDAIRYCRTLGIPVPSGDRMFTARYISTTPGWHAPLGGVVPPLAVIEDATGLIPFDRVRQQVYTNLYTQCELIVELG